ncbi:hypothetical protein FGG08_005171 [Glutinoglossum americanum]|uniref:Uncharacterized protein n=1 Tax=Glutinoglossum americanum TaxID=1670608 RepID=A0A9P8L216_9PEZI|nr:hypothetical protein FGG08_005171 [Glutinoglossum americanum]
MPFSTPSRTRSGLYLTLPPASISPTPSPFRGSPASTSFTPFGVTNYSPFRSAGLQPPSHFGGPVPFCPRRQQAGGYVWCRARRCLSSRTLWFVVAFFGLLLWWGNGGKEDWQTMRNRSSDLGIAIFGSEITKDLRFFPASDPKIHIDTYSRYNSGAYFDITINSTNTLLLSLHNSASAATSRIISPTEAVTLPDPGHLSFHTSPSRLPAPPISLLARIDQEEYILIPNSASLVSIRMGDLDPHTLHDVRVIAPMTDDSGQGKMEFEGVWLSKGGKLLRVQGSQLIEEFEAEDTFETESDNAEKAQRLDSSDIDMFEEANNSGNARTAGQRKKVLEIVTDSPGSLGGSTSTARAGGGNGLLGGVMGWDYLLGEMFGADHISIGVDGMCLIEDCIGGTGQPAGIGDIFNLGSADQASFEKYVTEYNRSTWELFERFEDTYISLIKSIRQLAYPNHPDALSYGSGNTAPVSIPIFIMRPFRGELEHATQAVVDRLRSEGDMLVFWLDTSGWLDTEDMDSEDRDFYVDSSDRWRLTEAGNQRVAIFLHMHTCRYLAQDGEKCAFLPPEVYQGKVFDPEAANLERFLESEKERKLRALFWEK